MPLGQFLHLYIARVRSPADRTALFLSETYVQCAQDAKKEDNDPNEDHARGDDGFGPDAIVQMIRHFRHYIFDFVRRLAAGRSEEVLRRARVGDANRRAKREGVIGDGGEVDVRVIGDPVEALLETGDFEPDQTFEDARHGTIEDRAAKSAIEHVCRIVDEHVEGIVDGAGGGIDPAKDLVVDVVVDVHDRIIRAVGPRFRGVFQFADDQIGKVTDFVG